MVDACQELDWILFFKKKDSIWTLQARSRKFPRILKGRVWYDSAGPKWGMHVIKLRLKWHQESWKKKNEGKYSRVCTTKSKSHAPNLRVGTNVKAKIGPKRKIDILAQMVRLEGRVMMRKGGRGSSPYHLLNLN